jgi:hypothetical protein
MNRKRRRRILESMQNDSALSLEMRVAAATIGEYVRENGRRGGNARARCHSREQLAEWGRIRHKKAAFLDSPEIS